MSKDFKEKYEKVCSIKDKALCLVETQMNGDISSVDAKELGEVADIAKDMAELMKLCSEAEYYHKVTEAMDESSQEDKSYYLNKYIPEYEGKFYTPMDYARMRDSKGRYMYTNPLWEENYRNRMYYSSMDSSKVRDPREGRSPMMRRTYMEMKEHGKNANEELEKYIDELGDDIYELINNMDSGERNILKQKMTELINNI